MEAAGDQSRAGRAGGPAGAAVRGAGRGWRLPARQHQRELAPLRQGGLPSLRRAGQPRPRAAVAVDQDGAGPGHRRPAAEAGRGGEGARRAGRLPGVRRADRADRGGERGDLRGSAPPGGACRPGPCAAGAKGGLCEAPAADPAGGGGRLAARVAASPGAGAEAEGAGPAGVIEAKAAAIAARQVAPLPRAAPLRDMLYIAIEGTGVPMTPAETEGRPGKAEDGKARTREVKLCCVFTQTSLDDKGRPVRDPHSSSYLATFAPASEFGVLMTGEARRRGAAHVRQLVILGDGP